MSKSSIHFSKLKVGDKITFLNFGVEVVNGVIFWIDPDLPVLELIIEKSQKLSQGTMGSDGKLHQVFQDSQMIHLERWDNWGTLSMPRCIECKQDFPYANFNLPQFQLICWECRTITFPGKYDFLILKN